MPTLATLPPGDTGTKRTLRTMRQMARAAAVTPLVRQAAADIVRHVAPRDARGQAREIRAWLRDYVQFMRDPAGVELVQAPDTMLRAISTRGMAQGDCDDVATLAAALGMAVGLPARYVVLAFKPGAPFSHVYAELAPPNGGDWIEMDIFRGNRTYPAGAVSRAAAMVV